MAQVARQRQGIKVGEGASTFFLLAVLLLSVTGSIDAANWTDGLGLQTGAVLGGLVFGFLLAKLPVRGLLAHALMLTLALPAVASLGTLLLPNALTFSQKLLMVQERTQIWFGKVAAGKEGSDSLIFVLQLALVMWIVGYVAAWFVYRRHQAWGAILPPGFALLINLFYAVPQTGFYLMIFLLCALLLLVRLNLRALEEWWRGGAIGYASDIGFDFLLYGAIFAVLLMTLAWLVPPSAPGPSWVAFLEPLQEPWQGVENQFTRIFNTLNAVGRPVPTTFFGTSLLMGGPVRLGTRPVMDIRADVGRYWRAAVYDEYIGTGWIDTQTDTLNLDANETRLDFARDLLRVDVTQTVQVYLPDQQNTLFAEAQPIRFLDLPTEVHYLAQPLDEANAGGPDITLVRSRRPLRGGDFYTVVSSVSLADPDSLRAAPTQYSDWMVQTFLQMPPDTPARVRALALEITKGATNPFDQAIAIQEYLRTNIKYNDSVSAPPPGRDGVDYTLFDRREGYCNYYASAMAVLAREVGVPARVASGYALGDYKDGVFHVIEANAHTWPELYFQDFGWVSFEPTVSQPEIVWPAKPRVSADQSDRSGSDVKPPGPPRRDNGHDAGTAATGGLFLFDHPFWNDPINLALAGSGLVALLLIGILVIRQRQQARRLAVLAPAARVYENILERARWLGVREQMHATPFERARAIGDALPEARREVERIAAMYAREKFGARTLGPLDRADLTDAWSQFGATWWRALVAQTLDRTITPPRNFLRRARVRLEHWGGNIPRG